MKLSSSTLVISYMLISIGFTMSSATLNKDGGSRIVGGTSVPTGTYPWFASLIRAIGPLPLERIHGCGAMLVSPEFVLTANHCITNSYRNNPAVRVGAFKKPFKENNNGGQYVEFFRVDQIFEHPDYNEDSIDKDFTLLHLDGKSKIAPVKVDSSNISNTYSTGYQNLWTIGHGALSYGGYGPDRLNQVRVDYVSNSDCTDKFGYDEEDISDSMMCAMENGGDSCQGDSGGPLYDKANDVLVGVVSWGNGCADPNYPGVYARVSDQYEWMLMTICQHSHEKPAICNHNVTASQPPVPSPIAAPSFSTKNPSGSTKNPSHSTKNPSHSTKNPSHSTKNPSHSTKNPSNGFSQLKPSLSEQTKLVNSKSRNWVKRSTTRISGGSRRLVRRERLIDPHDHMH